MRRALALIAALGLSHPASGEVIELFPSECDASPPLEELVGTYRINVFPGTLSDGVNSIAASHHSSDRVTFALIGKDLVLSGSEASPPIAFRYVTSDEPDWRGDDGVVSTDELAEVAGCNVNRLPRLIGSGSTMVDGISLEFTYRLMVWNMTPENVSLIGGMKWSGGGVTMTRRVMMRAE